MAHYYYGTLVFVNVSGGGGGQGYDAIPLEGSTVSTTDGNGGAFDPGLLYTGHVTIEGTNPTDMLGIGIALDTTPVYPPSGAAIGWSASPAGGANWDSGPIAFTTPGGLTPGTIARINVKAQASVAAQNVTVTWWFDPPGWVVDPPPEPGPIVDVYDPDDVFLATLPAKDVKLRIEKNDVGSGAFKINREAAEATAAILKRGNYVRVTIEQIDLEPIFGFFLDDGDFELVSTDEKGGEDLAFSGHGSLSYWARGMWLAESFLVPWWPDDMADPLPGDIGAIRLASGYYYHFTLHNLTNARRGVVGGNWVVTRTRFSTGGMAAYFDKQLNVHPTSTSTSLITVVRLRGGSHDGEWIGRFGAGKTTYLRTAPTYRFGNSVLMESIDDGDKPGQVVRAMYDEAFAADRPIHPIPLMTVDFDSTNDSDGAPWATTDALAAVGAELGDPYLSTLFSLVGTGVLDVEMGPDLDMHAYNAPHGVDRSSATCAAGKVRFVKGVNIADTLVRETTDVPIGTFAEVLGPNDGDVGRATLAIDEAPREISGRSESSSRDALDAFAEAELERRLLHSDSIAFNVATPSIGKEDELVGLYLPGPPGSARGKYWPGDLVTVHTGTSDQDFNNAIEELAAVVIWWDDGPNLRHSVELGSMIGGLPNDGSSSSGGGSSGGGGGGGGTVPSTAIFQTRDERDLPDGYPSLDADGRVDYRELETSWKISVRVASSTNIAIAALVDGATVDGLTVAEGDDVLLYGQTAPAENGVWMIPATGVATRRPDLLLDGDFLGAVVLVREGTDEGVAFRTTNATPPVVDTDAIDWTIFSAAAIGDPALDTAVWLPLTSVVAGEPVLVWDADDSLVPTLIPID